MAILPKALKTDTIVLQARLGRTKPYEDFSATVLAQSVQMVHNERRRARTTSPGQRERAQDSGDRACPIDVWES